MEWQQINGFYQVAKLGSFTRAAEATYRTQSALTQQIKSLELELDCQLFDRIGKRKIVLTPLGERLFRFSQSLLHEYNQLIEDIGEHKGLKKGRLRIAAPFTTLYHLLPMLVKRYNKHFPGVELSLLDRPQRDVIGLVKSGDVDFGIAVEAMIPRDLNKRKWEKVEPVLLTQTGHPLARVKQVSLDSVAQCPLILPPKSTEFLYRNKLEDLFLEHGLSYFVIMESSNIELSSLYVEMGLGVSFASIVKGLPVFKKRKLGYVSLSHYLGSEYICVATRKDKKMAAYQEAFLKMMFGD
jgi:DNA-binding transcriptional LysR family regulator